MKMLGVALIALAAINAVHALCGVPAMSTGTITNGPAISGCYRKSAYSGLYETPLYTVGGRDIVASGTKAIVASDEYSSNGDPTWVIGSVVSLPAYSWSDGYGAGVDIISALCVSNPPFWQATDPDPTDATAWKCDTNGDGVFTLRESGDFNKMICGCSASGEVTPPPVPTPTNAPVPGNVRRTQAPVFAGAPTPVGSVTQSPMYMDGSMAEEALACNLTLSSETLKDVSGCYVGQPSSNTRGRWVEPNTYASIYWKESGTEAGNGIWAIHASGTGIRCISYHNVDDPSDIDAALWRCNEDGGETYSADAVGDDFRGLLCTSTCQLNDGSQGSDSAESGSGSSSSSRKGIVAGVSVVASMMVVGAVIFALVLRRKNKKASSEGTGTAEEGGVASGEAPVAAALPEFDPWGSRPPPKTYQ